MKRVETVKTIERWAKDMCYNVTDICISPKCEWLVIDFNAATIIYMDIVELTKDLEMIWSNIKLYSFDSTYGKDNQLSIWFSL